MHESLCKCEMCLSLVCASRGVCEGDTITVTVPTALGWIVPFVDALALCVSLKRLATIVCLCVCICV